MNRSPNRLLVSLIVFVIAGACAMSTHYDPRLERDLVTLRDRVDGFLVQLETQAGTPEGEYAVHEPFYEELRATLDSLRGRVETTPVNAPTRVAFAGLSENLLRLESLHRQGLTRGEVPVLRKMLTIQLDQMCDLAAKGRG